MNQILQFVIPVAQPRQRQRVNAFKAACQKAATDALESLGGFEVLDCPLVLNVVFVLPRPAKVPKKLGIGRMPHTGKPDRDNLLKSLQDALQGIVYRDDSLIWHGTTQKVKAAQGESCKVEVEFRW